MLLFRNSLPNLNGHIRFLHSIPNAPNVDIYADEKLIYSNLPFGSITEYISLPPDSYNLKIYKRGESTTPLYFSKIEILPNSILTSVIAADNKNIIYLVLDDTHGPSKSFMSFIRFINLSPNAPLLSLSLPNGDTLFENTSYLESNNYYATSPGIYDFTITGFDSQLKKYISNVDLTKDSTITIYIIGMYNSTPPLGYILVKDGLEKAYKSNM